MKNDVKIKPFTIQSLIILMSQYIKRPRKGALRKEVRLTLRFFSLMVAIEFCYYLLQNDNNYIIQNSIT